MNTTFSGARIAQVNDMQMFFEIRGEGEALVLLHGGTGIGADWKLIFNDPPEGFRLVIPDLRGHGRSTNPSQKFTFRQSALDVFALLDQLKVGRFKAVGMSMGAKTLLHMATQQPNRVEAMTLVSAAHYFPEQARVVMKQASPEGHTEEEWEFMRRRHQNGDDQIWALWKMTNAFKDSYDDMNFTSPYLSTITARTLIVHGDRDPLYPINIPFELHNSIPGSFLWVIPNGGHGPIFGEHVGSGVTTSRFAETALAFLRGDWQGA